MSMKQAKTYLRFIVALLFLTSAFLLSIRFSDRGVQFDLRHSSSAPSDKVDAKPKYNLSALKILNSVLLHLKDNYVEPERINPSKMLVSALEEIQNAIAEVVITHDGKADKTDATSVTVSINNQKKAFNIKGIASLWEMSFKLKEIFTFIETALKDNKEIKYKDIEYAAINGMLNTLDPHSTLLPPQNYEEMQTQTGGKFGGLGIVISIRDGKLTVISPIDGTPASKKGIKAKDQIVRIGEESTINMSLTEAVGMLRGKPGTKATLWILRSGWTEPKRYDVERAIIKIESVDSQPLANKVGYLRIKNFQANTYADTKKHLKKLKTKMGGMQGLILDLRDNPGGLLNQSIRISDLFVDEGTIVSTVGKGNRLREKRRALSVGTEPKYPIIVLVNAGSASASEIVSGAIQNNNRGVVLGNTTFGKGSVQVLYEFPDKSALKLTIAQYLTPGGISIQGKGITPDLRTIPAAVTKKEIDMYLSNAVLREGDLATALKKNKTAKADKNKTSLFVRYFSPEDTKKKVDAAAADKFKEDFEIRLAQKLLKAAGKNWERKKMIGAIRGELKRVGDKEQASINKALKGLGIDWTAGKNPEKPNYTLKFTTTAKDNIIKAGDKVTLTATLTNNGAQPLYQMKALTDSDYKIFNDREFIFGKLGPNETRSWSMEFKVPKDASTRQDFVKFKVSDDSKVFNDKDGLALKIQKQDQPHFAFAYEIIDPNGDGIFQVGEEIKFRIHVNNTGKADSTETLVYLKNRSYKTIYLKRGREKLKSIPAGQTKHVDFSFKVKSLPKSGVAKLEIDVYDVTFREFTQKKIEIPVTAGEVTLKKEKGGVQVNAQSTLYGGASAKTDPVAVTNASTSLPVIGSANGWYKVKLGKRHAWIDGKQAKKTSKGAFDKSKVQMVFFEKPNVALTTNDTLTTKDKITLKGVLKDVSKLKDYYIFVYNRDRTTFNTKKVLYKRVSGASADIQATIPLFPGMNRIAVYVRDQQGMMSIESAYVYKK